MKRILKMMLVGTAYRPQSFHFTVPRTFDAMKIASRTRTPSWTLDLSIMASVTGD
jgi:hypothetical protein